MERWAYEYFRRQAIEDRCKQEAQWLIDNPKDSIRKVAREFCISKSQLHRDLHELRNIDDDLYVQCRNILRRGTEEVEEKLDKFLAYLEENGVEISGETAFKCDDGIVLFSPNEGGGVDITIIRNVVELNYNLGITDADVNLFNTEVGIMQELGGDQ